MLLTEWSDNYQCFAGFALLFYVVFLGQKPHGICAIFLTYLTVHCPRACSRAHWWLSLWVFHALFTFLCKMQRTVWCWLNILPVICHVWTVSGLTSAPKPVRSKRSKNYSAVMMVGSSSPELRGSPWRRIPGVGNPGLEIGCKGHSSGFVPPTAFSGIFPPGLSLAASLQGLQIHMLNTWAFTVCIRNPTTSLQTNPCHPL